MAVADVSVDKWVFNPLVFNSHCCIYCGSPFDIARDHVIPTSYLRVKRKYEGDWLVPACRECNSTLGDRLIFNVPDRALFVLRRYQIKKKRALIGVIHEQDELEQFGYSLRKYIEGWQANRLFESQRIEYLKAVSWMPKTYMAKLRPYIDPYDEDCPEFVDPTIKHNDDLSNWRGQ